MHTDTTKYNKAQTPADKAICKEGTFKAAEARDVQWDYRNLVRRKGQLVRLK